MPGERTSFEADLAVLESSDVWSRFPHPLFRAIREASPVMWSDRLDSWIVAGYPEMVEVLRDSAAFVVDYDQRAEPATGQDASSVELAYMVDPPRHGQLRGLFVRSGRLTPSAVDDLAPLVREAATRALDRYRSEGLDDAVAGFAHPVVYETFAELCGLTKDEMRSIAEGWARDRPLAEMDLPRAEALPIHQEVHAMLDAVVSRRLENPGEDFISRFAVANQTRERTRRSNLVWMLVDIVLNGSQSIRSAVALAIHALADHPEQFDVLRGKPALAGQAAEEVFRWTALAPLLTRRVNRDRTLNDAELRRGERLWLFIASANRDERVYDGPDHFDVRRLPEPPHLSFGSGIHQTPGAPLARMVVTNCLAVLGASVAQIRRQGPTDYWSGDAAEVQVKTLPVTFEER